MGVGQGRDGEGGYESYTCSKFRLVSLALVSFQEKGKQRRANICLRRILFIKATFMTRCALCSRHSSKCFAQILSFDNFSQQTREAGTNVVPIPHFTDEKTKGQCSEVIHPGPHSSSGVVVTWSCHRRSLEPKLIMTLPCLKPS